MKQGESSEGGKRLADIKQYSLGDLKVTTNFQVYAQRFHIKNDFPYLFHIF